MEYDKLQLIEEKAKGLLKDLKTEDDAFVYSTALLVLVVLFLLAIVFLYILSGVSFMLLIYLLVLIGILTYYKINMNRVYKESTLLQDYKNIDPSDKTKYVSGLLKYLASGVNIKLERLKSVRLFYTIMFPLFLLVIREIYLGSYTTKSFLISFLVAAILGGLFWYFYFSNGLDELEEDREEINELSSTIFV
jgi:ABC-type siderophore export system fused ATPase/permease subunit